MRSPNKDMGQVAEQFWKAADISRLAEHWQYEKKTPFDYMAIKTHIAQSCGIWDAASGDNRMAEIIRANEKCRVLCSDLSPVGEAREWNLNDGVPDWLPDDVDTVLLFGVIQYMSDKAVKSLLQNLRDKTVLIKTPCDNDVYVCKESAEMGGEYEAYYRSLRTVVNMLEESHKTYDTRRIYPPELESKFGSVQMLIVGVPR